MINRFIQLVLLALMAVMLGTSSWAAEKNMVFASPYGITTFSSINFLFYRVDLHGQCL
jgi:hypothetical protein